MRCTEPCTGKVVRDLPHGLDHIAPSLAAGGGADGAGMELVVLSAAQGVIAHVHCGRGVLGGLGGIRGHACADLVPLVDIV